MAYIEYRSFQDMNNAILKNLHKIPHDIDLVVGIPRSGMFPANLIALYLQKPFTDIDSFINGTIYSLGNRANALFQDTTKKKVFIVDDSIRNGTAIKKAQEKLHSVAENYNLLYGAIYATSRLVKKIDFYCEIIDTERVFQWNIFHHPTYIPQSCFDMDGVLCENPPIDDDGPQYLNYITHAPALYIPTVEIDNIVTCRLEKYRQETEEWLRQHHVKYKHLIMLDFKTKRERLAWGRHGEYKGEFFKRSKDILFVESSLSQARTISKISRKPVFCTENFDMVYQHQNTERWMEKIKVKWGLRELYAKIRFHLKKLIP